VNEAQELNAALKRDHASKLTELTNRTNQLQEKNDIMEEEISNMSQEMAALVKERRSLPLEKKALDFKIDDLQKMAFTAKSRVRICQLFGVFIHLNVND
jgi:predicted nuclease with TOPRIM domain